MVDFVTRLVKSKTFHLCMAVIAAAVAEYFRGTVSLHAAALVCAASLVAILMTNAIKKGFEQLAGRLGISAETVARIEDLAEQEVAAQLEAHKAGLVSQLVAHGVDPKTADTAAGKFISGVATATQPTDTVAKLAVAEQAPPAPRTGP